MCDTNLISWMSEILNLEIPDSTENTSGRHKSSAHHCWQLMAAYVGSACWNAKTREASKGYLPEIYT